MKKITIQLPDELFDKMMKQQLDWNKIAVKKFEQVVKALESNKELTSAVFTQEPERIKELTKKQELIDFDKVVKKMTQSQ